MQPTIQTTAVRTQMYLLTYLLTYARQHMSINNIWTFLKVVYNYSLRLKTCMQTTRRLLLTDSITCEMKSKCTI